jgi:hypothetical protein
MHEVVLGGWRAILIQLLRMLQSLDDQLLVELDRRYGRSMFLAACLLTLLVKQVPGNTIIWEGHHPTFFCKLF